MQCGNPERLYVRAFLEGSIEDERRIHKQLRDYRLRNEWFEAPQALQALGMLRAGAEISALEHMVRVGEMELLDLVEP